MHTVTPLRLLPFALLVCVAAGAGADQMLAGRLTRRDAVAALLARAVIAFSATRAPFRDIASARFGSVNDLRRVDWWYLRY